MELFAGSEIEGRYVTERLLGRGGMASVWRVRHLHLGSAHALKVLHTTHPEIRARLLEEGRIQARLKHPNVVRVTDLVSLPAGVGLILDLVEGPDLRAWLDTGRPPLPLALEIAAGLLDGVAYAHDAGLIHRDLKPDNVLLEQGPEGLIPRVADFGLALALAAGERHTRTGIAMGTPGYMPPEQYRDTASVDARADVFALGAILYELTCGQRPFGRGGPLELHQKAVAGAFAPPASLAPALPAPLAALLSRALHPDPRERPRDAGELRRRWREGHGGAEVADGGAPTALRPAPAEALGSTDTLDWSVIEQAEPAPAQGRHNLSPRGDAFFGRGDERARLRALLGAGPGLITVLGPGGIGKTRLVTELGLELARDPGEIWLCDLTEAHTVEGICHVLAGVLEVPLGGGDPVERLGAALDGRARGCVGRLLLILDNFEQLTEFAPQTVGRWRQRATGVSFLVTSRALLELPGEQPFTLEPLAAQGAAGLTGPGVELFMARALARSPALGFPPERRAEIAALVGLLDGLPLAIELAAARAGVLSPGAMAKRLEERVASSRFRLLGGRSRGVSPRQATLRGAIAWSWELLEGWEQAAFAQCSVFEGGFTLEAAEAVLELGDHWAMDAVQSLVDKSLLFARQAPPDRPGAEPRFGMYLSLHDFAAEQLQGAARDAAQRRHLRFFAEKGRAPALRALQGQGGRARWWALADDVDNLDCALGRALALGDGEAAARLARALGEVLQRRGPFSVAIEALERALAADGGQSADARMQLGALYKQSGDKARAREALEEAREAFAASGERRALADALNLLGGLELDVGRMEEAAATLERSLALLQALEDGGEEVRIARGVALNSLGIIAFQQGRIDDCRALFERALASYRGADARQNEGRLLGNLGVLHKEQGRLDEAERCYQQALERAREVGDRLSESNLIQNLAALYTHTKPAHAMSWHEAALKLSREIGNRSGEGYILTNLGSLMRSRGRPVESRAHLEAALEIHRALAARRMEGITLGALGNLLLEQGALDEARGTLEQALEIARGLGNQRSEAQALLSLGVLEHRLGRLGEARALLEASLALDRALGDLSSEACTLGALGQVLVDQGEVAEGLGHLDRADTLYKTVYHTSEGASEWVSLKLRRVRVELSLGQEEQARATLADAEALALAPRGASASDERSLAELRRALPD